MSDFGTAFASARKAGKKEFTFNGKRYHTRTKEEDDAKARKSAPATKAPATKAPAKKPANRTTAGVGVPPRSRIADSYKRMAASPGGVPGRKTSSEPATKKPAAKPAAKRSAPSRRGSGARSR